MKNNVSVPAPHTPLKSCAFCGGSIICHVMNNIPYFVCHGCGAHTCFSLTYEHTSDVAIPKWNCRVVRTPEEIYVMLKKFHKLEGNYDIEGEYVRQINVLRWVLCEREEL